MFFKKLKTLVDKIDHTTGLKRDLDRIYALFLVPCGEEDSYSGNFVVMKGRKEVFDYCMDYVVTGEYDILRSQILSENMSLGNEVSLYTFLRLAIEVYRYDDISRLDFLDEITNNTYIKPNSLESSYLSRFYSQECNQSAR